MPGIKAALFMKVHGIRVALHALRARAALARIGRDPAERAELTTFATEMARQLSREKIAWADGWAAVVSAGCAAARGDAQGTAAELRAAAKAFDLAEMALHAA